jgi:hypothetical protein
MKTMQNHRKIFFSIRVVGYNGDKSINLDCSDNFEKVGKSLQPVNQMPAQMKLIDAKKVHQKIAWDCPFNKIFL